MQENKKYNEEGMRLTDCCGAYSTIDLDSGDLCCRSCYQTVEVGEGDGGEYRD